MVGGGVADYYYDVVGVRCCQCSYNIFDQAERVVAWHWLSVQGKIVDVCLLSTSNTLQGASWY